MKFRPRFSLRTLLILVALISIPLGWLGYHLNWIRQRRAFAERNYYDAQPTVINRYVRSDRNPPWPLTLLGDPGYSPRQISIPWSEVKLYRELFPEFRQ